MPPYMTLRRFKNSGYGLDLSQIPDHELAAALNRSSRAADRYCNVPLVPARHSFFGGVIEGEHRSWIDTEARRIYPFHTPIKSVDGLKIQATNQLEIDFATTELYVHPIEGYVEIINWAISKVGIWNIGGLPSFGLAQPVAIIDYAYGYDYSVEDEELNPTGISGEYMAENGYWDPDAIVKQNGTALVDTTDYVLDAESGMLILDDTKIDLAKTLTASYSYHLPTEIAEATGIIGIDRLLERKFIPFSGMEEIQVEELRLRRPRLLQRTQSTEHESRVPPEAQDLLDDFVFVTIR